jgi:serine phosphatase RsbU (regulator of sigma subunit)
LLSYAGAKNDLLVIQNGEIKLLEAERKAIGEKASNEFTQQQLTLSAGDCLYLFSDGFHDQIGGANSKRFMSKNLRKLLADIYTQPANAQKELLQQTFSEWRGEQKQLDDVLIMGLRLG